MSEWVKLEAICRRLDERYGPTCWWREGWNPYSLDTVLAKALQRGELPSTGLLDDVRQKIDFRDGSAVTVSTLLNSVEVKRPLPGIGGMLPTFKRVIYTEVSIDASAFDEYGNCVIGEPLPLIPIPTSIPAPSGPGRPPAVKGDDLQTMAEEFAAKGDRLPSVAEAARALGLHLGKKETWAKSGTAKRYGNEIIARMNTAGPISRPK